uniref:Bm198 n=1 Tax=Brugia malayi TaxID=6279 RepID=A0A0J9XM79_BRUMA|nr:Bm198 [Brugia malayi]
MVNGDIIVDRGRERERRERERERGREKTIPLLLVTMECSKH